MNHDLSLKDLHSIKEALNSKLEKESHSFLADVYELEGENTGLQDDEYGLDDYFVRAIEIRSKQIGEFNLANAVSYCNYSKYLIMCRDYKKARSCLEKATEIYACFSDNHPIKWLLLYCYGMFNSAQRGSHLQTLDFFKTCLKQIEEKFDRTHITYNKIRLQYA